MPRRILQGVVVGISGDKTIKVKVVRNISHESYGKKIKVSKNYLVHDEKSICKKGDVVKMVECRPMSKNKHFSILEDSATIN